MICNAGVFFRTIFKVKSMQFCYGGVYGPLTASNQDYGGGQTEEDDTYGKAE